MALKYYIFQVGEMATEPDVDFVWSNGGVSVASGLGGK